MAILKAIVDVFVGIMNSQIPEQIMTWFVKCSNLTIEAIRQIIQNFVN